MDKYKGYLYRGADKRRDRFVLYVECWKWNHALVTTFMGDGRFPPFVRQMRVTAAKYWGDANLGDDAAQHAVTAILEYTRHLAGRLEPWLVTAGTNFIIGEARCRGRRPTVEFDDERPEVVAIDRVPCEDDDDDRRRLWAAIQRLEADDQEILIARYFENMTCAGYARWKGLNREAAKSRLQRARDRLRPLIPPDLAE